MTADTVTAVGGAAQKHERTQCPARRTKSKCHLHLARTRLARIVDLRPGWLLILGVSSSGRESHSYRFTPRFSLYAGEWNAFFVSADWCVGLDARLNDLPPANSRGSRTPRRSLMMRVVMT